MTQDVLAETSDLLSEISGSLSDIVLLLGKKPDSSVAQAIVEGLRNLVLKASDVQVNVPPMLPPDAPVIKVNVAAPAVTVAAPEIHLPPSVMTGWRMTVVARDENGRPREILLKPEV